MALSVAAGRPVECDPAARSPTGWPCAWRCRWRSTSWSRLGTPFVQVSERAIARAVGAFAAAGIRVEGSAAAALAALGAIEPPDGPIVLIVTGHNIDDELYRRAVEEPDSFPLARAHLRQRLLQRRHQVGRRLGLLGLRRRLDRLALLLVLARPSRAARGSSRCSARAPSRPTAPRSPPPPGRPSSSPACARPARSRRWGGPRRGSAAWSATSSPSRARTSTRYSLVRITKRPSAARSVDSITFTSSR